MAKISVINESEKKTDPRDDFFEICGVESCSNGLQCLKECGYSKYCQNCMCRECKRGKCHNPDGTQKKVIE